jgi:PBSX family phage terminase large subunit
MKYQNLSKRQLLAMTWWKRPAFRHLDGIICDGSIRSGKTVSMSVGFVLWAMAAFDGAVFGICGKTIESLRRNVITQLPTWLEGVVAIKERRNENKLMVSVNGRTNSFYLFGGRDESSYTLIQGITLAGVLFDEVALMPRSFVEQAIARCSVDGSKFWFNCNPEGPDHWFYKEWVLQCGQKNVLHLHFTMDDNNSLPEKIKTRYEGMYSGVFYDRYIRGLWVVAEGLIYRQFAENKALYVKKLDKDQLRDVQYVSIGVDFGGSRSLTTFVATAMHNGFKKITVVADHHIKAPKGEIDADRLCREFIAFVGRVRARFPWLYIKYVWADNEAQYLINSLRKAARDAGLGVEVLDSKKKRIKDRIFAGNTLLNTKRMVIGDDCTLVQGGLENAVWDGKKPDERLDNFSTDIDILDAFEYSWEPFMARLCPDMKER